MPFRASYALRLVVGPLGSNSYALISFPLSSPFRVYLRVSSIFRTSVGTVVLRNQPCRNQAEVVRLLRQRLVQDRLALGLDPALVRILAPARDPDLDLCLLLPCLAVPVLAAEAPLSREKGSSLVYLLFFVSLSVYFRVSSSQFGKILWRRSCGLCACSYEHLQQ